MDVGPLKKDVCKNKQNISREINNLFDQIIILYYYGSRESKSIDSDTTMEVC
jgi:hypothetical protein